jgi:hypothetical protein
MQAVTDVAKVEAAVDVMESAVVNNIPPKKCESGEG